MTESAFEKIIRVRSVDLAVLDESAYYETIYAGNSVPDRKFYAVGSPFRMNSQASVIFEKDSVANKNKPKRKRKHDICSNITCDLRDASFFLNKMLKKAVAMDAFIKKEYELIPCSSTEASLDFNNCLARQSVLTASSVPCPLSRYARQQCTTKQNIKEIRLNEKKKIIDDIPNELIMWVNAESKVVTAECKGEKFVLPPFSSFIVSDVCASKALIRYGKRFDFILLDPPWENKSVKRKTVYTTYEDQSWMGDLYVPELLTESGLFAIWVTNNARHFKFIDDMVEYFGFEKIATWRWLKVTNNGEPVYSLNSQHKQPFESIVFASNSTSHKYYMNIVDEFVLIRYSQLYHQIIMHWLYRCELEDAIRSVPKSLRYGFMALGATPTEIILQLIMPYAMPTILSAILLSISRMVLGILIKYHKKNESNSRRQQVCFTKCVDYFDDISDVSSAKLGNQWIEEVNTPSAIHSRKPPLFPVLQALGILEESATQLELYGRYLLSHTTTIGFEAAKLQNKRYFA